MNEANPLNGTTGGSVPTGNPQDIGSQSIANTQGGLQSGSPSLFTGSSLTLTDQNGKPLDLSSSSTVQTPAAKTTKHHNALIIIGISALAIVVIVAISWFMNRNNDLVKKH